MKSWGRLIWIFFAYGLALLHTAVPHHHGAGRDGETILTHAGCQFEQNSGGLLQRALSTDLGIGHLETFKKGGAEAEIEFTVRWVASIAEVLRFSDKTITLLSPFHRYIDCLHKFLLLFSNAHLRAPPLH